MNNSDKIKSTFSNIRPSDECIERVMDMTNEKKKVNIGFKKVASVALAFAILCAGGFGINAHYKKADSFISPSGYSIGGLMSVHAKEELKGETTLTMGYRIYRVDITGMTDEEIQQEKIDLAKLWLCGGDEEALVEEEHHFDKDTMNDTLKKNIHQTGNILYTTDRGSEFDSITLCGIDDPTSVKEIRVLNSGKYGYPIIEADDLYFQKAANGSFVFNGKNVDTSQTDIKGHNISLSGERYAMCREIENPNSVAYAQEALDKNSEFYGVELATGRIFSIIYHFSNDFYKMLGENPNYNFADFNDQLTVVVEFNDGKVATNVIDLKLDVKGNMYCQLNSYDYK